MLNDIFARHWITLHGLIVLLGLGVYAAGSHALKQRRHPSAGIAWVVSLVLLPYVALPLYLVFGSRKVVSARRLKRPHTAPPDNPTAPPAEAERLAKALGLGEAASFSQLAVHAHGSQALDALRMGIHGASQRLDICTFILGNDVLGDEICELLARRTREGIQVRLLLDGIGRYLGGPVKLKRLRDAGVQVALFVPPLRSPLRGRTNLRNHRKMVLADGEWLWCGGRNLAAEYFEGDAQSFRKKPVWIDLSFDLRGDLAQQAQQRFERDWSFATTGVTEATPPPTTAVANDTDSRGRLVPSGPDQTEDTVYTLLVSACFTAKSRILAVTPYFVPDSTLLMALALAARRGVAVTLLMPAHSNHRLADIARHAALRELAASGAHIWLSPHMVHAKAVLIDEDMALVGSANLDERSLFLNYELMVAFYDASVVQTFSHWVEHQQASAKPYKPRPPGLARELVEAAVRWVAFQL